MGKKGKKQVGGAGVIVIGIIISMDVFGLWYLIFQQCSCGTP